MKWNTHSVGATYLAVGALLAAAGVGVEADAPANPNPFDRTVKSSNKATKGEMVTVQECLKGNPKVVRRTDCSHHTIITDEKTGEDVYAILDEETGGFASSGCGLDDPDCNPDKAGIPPDVEKSPVRQEADCGVACHFNSDPPVNRIIARHKKEKKKKAKETSKVKAKGKEDEDDDERRRMAQFGDHNGGSLKDVTVMQNLVLLIRFSDHSNRCLPSKDDIDVLFNKKDSTDALAPSGSVRDCFRYNSYFDFDLQSRICSWCDAPGSESYYGDNNYGMTGLLSDAIKHCLAQCENEMGGFGDFDVDSDGKMDAIAILHSGYGGEWGGDGFEQRIWSHKWEMPTAWTGWSGVEVYSYHISPSLWGTDGCNIGRIGVICHETGHFFGLPDLYDGSGGNGVGTTCLMGNSWGFDGSQHYPPMMSAWAKIRLGWADPEVITQPGTYELHPAATNSKVYVFVNPSNSKEYFLMENKQHYEFFEAKLPQEGINIYHIDDNAAYDSEAYPGEYDWPGEHYRIAVVQPDGKYHLEKGMNLGDEGDVFHGGYRDLFGPNGVGRGGSITSSQPTTDWYGSGSFVSSGIKIYDISQSQPVMSFKVEMTGGGTGKDYDWGGDGRDTNTCANTNEECENHVDCCSPPKRRCRYIKKLRRNGCKLKGKKRKKVMGITRKLGQKK